METYSFHREVQTALDGLVMEYGCTYDSLEGLNSNIIGRLFVSVVDTFGGLLKTFGTNITRASKAIKRSELNEFVMSNALKTRTVDKLPYEKCIDTQVDIPANMKGTYKASVSALEQVYTRLNAINNGKLVDTAFREALNSINTRDTKLSKQVASTAKVVSDLMHNARASVDLCLAQFEGKFNYKVPFQKAFLSSQEWLDVRKMLIECEPRLQDIKPLTDIVTSMEGTLRSISTAADANGTPVTAADLKNMAETAKGIALVFDAYGMATTRQMTLEHNYILCLNNLYDNVK